MLFYIFLLIFYFFIFTLIKDMQEANEINSFECNSNFLHSFTLIYNT